MNIFLYLARKIHEYFPFPCEENAGIFPILLRGNSLSLLNLQNQEETLLVSGPMHCTQLVTIAKFLLFRNSADSRLYVRV